MQKVYVTEEQKEKFMEKVNRDVEVSDVLQHYSATWWQQQCCSQTLIHLLILKIID